MRQWNQCPDCGKLLEPKDRNEDCPKSQSVFGKHAIMIVEALPEELFREEAKQAMIGRRV